MRSNQLHVALSHGYARFEICNMIAKGLRATHASGMRTEESINRVLCLIGPKKIAPELAIATSPQHAALQPPAQAEPAQA